MQTPVTPNAAKPKSRGRWFSFSLRTLLIGVTLLGIPSGYVGWRLKIASDRAATVVREAKLGWRFVVDSMPPLRKPTGVILPAGATHEDIQRAEREFPEMQIIPTWDHRGPLFGPASQNRPNIEFGSPTESERDSQQDK